MANALRRPIQIERYRNELPRHRDLLRQEAFCIIASLVEQSAAKLDPFSAVAGAMQAADEFPRGRDSHILTDPESAGKYRHSFFDRRQKECSGSGVMYRGSL